MMIYLDTKDLIELLERESPVSADAFSHVLKQDGHQLAVSLFNIREIAQPLLRSSTQSSVMLQLTRLERITPVFIKAPVLFTRKCPTDRWR